jgi:hypothetical protein
VAFLKDISDFMAMNEVCRKYFTSATRQGLHHRSGNVDVSRRIDDKNSCSQKCFFAKVRDLAREWRVAHPSIRKTNRGCPILRVLLRRVGTTDLRTWELPIIGPIETLAESEEFELEAFARRLSRAPKSRAQPRDL